MRPLLMVSARGIPGRYPWAVSPGGIPLADLPARFPRAFSAGSFLGRRVQNACPAIRGVDAWVGFHAMPGWAKVSTAGQSDGRLYRGEAVQA